jgi:hypothetical protein
MKHNLVPYFSKQGLHYYKRKAPQRAQIKSQDSQAIVALISLSLRDPDISALLRL